MNPFGNRLYWLIGALVIGAVAIFAGLIWQVWWLAAIGGIVGAIVIGLVFYALANTRFT